MIAKLSPFRSVQVRSALLLSLCALVASLSACKKKEEAAPAAAAGEQPASGEQPAEPAPKEEPAVELKAKWPVGRRLVTQISTQTDTEMSNPALPAPFKSENLLVQDLAFNIGQAKPDGGCDVDVEVVGLRADNKAGGKPAPGFDPKADPKQDRNNPLATALRKLQGSRVKYQTDANGQITKVDGLTQLKSKVTSGIVGPQLFMISALISEDAIKGWNFLHANLPTNSVKAGDTWESTREIPFGIARFVLTSTNTFKGWEQRQNRKLAKIEMTGAIAAKEGAQAAITLGETSAIVGKSWYDTELGVLVESEITTDFSVNIPQPTGQTSSSKIHTKTTSKVVDRGDAGAATPAPAQPAEKK